MASERASGWSEVRPVGAVRSRADSQSVLARPLFSSSAGYVVDSPWLICSGRLHSPPPNPLALTGKQVINVLGRLVCAVDHSDAPDDVRDVQADAPVPCRSVGVGGGMQGFSPGPANQDGERHRIALCTGRLAGPPKEGIGGLVVGTLRACPAGPFRVGEDGYLKAAVTVRISP